MTPLIVLVGQKQLLGTQSRGRRTDFSCRKARLEADQIYCLNGGLGQRILNWIFS